MDRQRMKVKICLVGEGAVGKTCLIRRFIQDQFDDRYISTLGAKVSKKELKVDGANGGADVDMTIWDIMGEKGFRELLKEAYFHGAQGVLAVCDVTRKQTLDDLDDWVAAVLKVTGNVPITYLANGKQYVAMPAGIGGGSWSTLLAPELAPEIRRPNGGNVLLVFALPSGADSKGQEVQR